MNYLPFAKAVRSLLFTALLFVSVFTVMAQPPAGYYSAAEGLDGQQLKQTLHNIIKNHNPRTYSQLWNDFNQTDKKSNGKVWDMYSDVPGGTPAYEYTFFSDQCGNYNSEGDCYNREHSWPKSWFDDQMPMYTDMFHLVPTDGYVNGKRSNYPYGEVGSASWTSTNGSKLGSCVTEGYSGTVFEPIDEYKGDLARGYFYMSVRYLGEDSNWPGSAMVDGAEIRDWALAMLLRWSQEDPVSQKEIDRNNAIYALQQNRNPFIDDANFAVRIWDPTASVYTQQLAAHLRVFPNPAQKNGVVSVEWTSQTTIDQLRVVDISGRILVEQQVQDQTNTYQNSLSLESGFYFLQLIHQNEVVATSKLILN